MKEEIRQLIAKGKLDEALNKMMSFSDDVILLKAQLGGEAAKIKVFFHFNSFL